MSERDWAVMSVELQLGLPGDDEALTPLLTQLIALQEERWSSDTRRPTARHARSHLALFDRLAFGLRIRAKSEPVHRWLGGLETQSLIWATGSPELADDPELAAALAGRLLEVPAQDRSSERDPTAGLINLARYPTLRTPALLEELRGRASAPDAATRATIYAGGPYVFPPADDELWTILDRACDDERDPVASQSLIDALIRLCNVEPARASARLVRRLRSHPPDAGDNVRRAKAAHALVEAGVVHGARAALDWLDELASGLTSDHEYVGPALARAADHLTSPDAIRRERARRLFHRIGAQARDPDLPAAVKETTLSAWGVWWALALTGRSSPPRVPDAEQLDQLLTLLEPVFPTLANDYMSHGLNTDLDGLVLIVKQRPHRVLHLLNDVPAACVSESMSGAPVLDCLRILLSRPEITNHVDAFARTLDYLDRLLELDVPHAIALALQHADLWDT